MEVIQGMCQVVFRVSPEVKQGLINLARARRMTMTAIMAEALEDLFEKEQRNNASA